MSTQAAEERRRYGASIVIPVERHANYPAHTLFDLQDLADRIMTADRDQLATALTEAYDEALQRIGPQDAVEFLRHIRESSMLQGMGLQLPRHDLEVRVTVGVPTFRIQVFGAHSSEPVYETTHTAEAAE